jgi:hypothetical protein
MVNSPEMSEFMFVNHQACGIVGPVKQPNQTNTIKRPRTTQTAMEAKATQTRTNNQPEGQGMTFRGAI